MTHPRRSPSTAFMMNPYRSTRELVTPYQLRLPVHASRRSWHRIFTVTVEEVFTVQWTSGTTSQYDPGGDPLKMGETLGLVRRRIDRAHAFEDGRLEVDFEGGILLRVPGGHGYEPWNVHGPGSMLMVSGTDGELIIWD